MKGKKLKSALQVHRLDAKLRRPLSNDQPNAPGAKPKQTHQKRAPVFPFEEWDSILFIGEGNFSYAHAILEKLHGACEVFATAYDSEQIVHEKYPDAQAHIDAIRELGGEVVFGIDGTNLDVWKAGRKKRFSKIVFHFPHVGTGLKDRDRNVRANQELVFSFLASASTHLALDGEIQITIKAGDPYDLWDVKRQAIRTRVLKCSRSFDFVPALYPEYSHRRTIGFLDGLSTDANEEILKAGNPRTYAFVLDVGGGGSGSGDGKDKKRKKTDAPEGKRKRRKDDGSDSDD